MAGLPIASYPVPFACGIRQIFLPLFATRLIMPNRPSHSLEHTSRHPGVVRLSRREIELLRETAEGKTAQEISDQLGVAERTANFHINNAMAKLQAANKTHAVALAMRLGLLD
jgi:DNA-binding CsgD family transcriptional regulator